MQQAKRTFGVDGCPRPGLEVNTAFFRFPVAAGDRCPALVSLGAVSLPQSWCFSLPNSKGGPGPVSSALGGLQLTGQRREAEAHRVKADSICICSPPLGAPGSRCSFCAVPPQDWLLQPAPGPPGVPMLLFLSSKVSATSDPCRESTGRVGQL